MRDNLSGSCCCCSGAQMRIPRCSCCTNSALHCFVSQGSSWGLLWEMIVGKLICLLPLNCNSCIVWLKLCYRLNHRFWGSISKPLPAISYLTIARWRGFSSEKSSEKSYIHKGSFCPWGAQEFLLWKMYHHIHGPDFHPGSLQILSWNQPTLNVVLPCNFSSVFVFLWCSLYEYMELINWKTDMKVKTVALDKTLDTRLSRVLGGLGQRHWHRMWRPSKLFPLVLFFCDTKERQNYKLTLRSEKTKEFWLGKKGFVPSSIPGWSLWDDFVWRC